MTHCRVARSMIVVATLAAVTAVACGSSGSSSKTATTAVSNEQSSKQAVVSGGITVFAASSLTDAFNKLATDFETANPGASVAFNFAGSPALVTQLQQGADADILATADTKNMQTALDSGVVVDLGKTFATNRLAIIVPKSNPGGIASPRELSKPGLKLVLAANDVPVGTYARRALETFSADPSYGADFSEKVLGNIVSEETNVKAVVAKIQLDEADAGIVYVTDVTPGVAGDVTQIEIPDEYNVIATYPIAVTKNADHADVAHAFIDYVLSSAGQATLREFGFGGN